MICYRSYYTGSLLLVKAILRLFEGGLAVLLKRQNKSHFLQFIYPLMLAMKDIGLLVLGSDSIHCLLVVDETQPGIQG